MTDPEFVQALTGWNSDLGVVAAYGKILTETLLGTPRLGMLNVHASLLPNIAAPLRSIAPSSTASAKPASPSCGS